jgi:hypothetical protein
MSGDKMYKQVIVVTLQKLQFNTGENLCQGHAVPVPTKTKIRLS